MVDSSVVTAFIINIIICFGLPVGCILYLVIAKKRAIIPALVGAAVFFIFQLVIRIPLFTYVLSPMGWWKAMQQQPWLYGLFLGLTAGIFEEGGRYLGYRIALKKRDRWIDGFSFGVGHGGIEAIALVGFTNINNVVLSSMINNGQFNQIAAVLPADSAQQLLSQMTSAQPFDVYLGGIERILAFIIQIALSLLVLMAVRNRKPWILGVAVLAHMFVDAPVVILPQVFGASIYGIEIFVAVVAVLALVFIILSRRAFTEPAPIKPFGEPGPRPGPDLPKQ